MTSAAGWARRSQLADASFDSVVCTFALLGARSGADPARAAPGAGPAARCCLPNMARRPIPAWHVGSNGSNRCGNGLPVAAI